MSAEVVDFVVVEFQTGQTTSTGGLVTGLKEFMHGTKVSEKTYNFGLNVYDIWKRTFTQVLTKGIIMENWGHKIYWVLQEPIYKDFEKRYNLQKMKYNPSHSTVFAVYDLVKNQSRLDLVNTRTTSSSIDQLFHSFRNNPTIPSVDEFKGKLRQRIEGQMHLGLRLDRPTKGKVDAPRSPK